jgi:hypothetical protein
VRNNKYRHRSPDIRIAMSGIQVPEGNMTAVPLNYQGTNTLPLEIFGPAPPARRHISRGKYFSKVSLYR